MAKAVLITEIPIWRVTASILLPASTRQQAWDEVQKMLDAHCAGIVTSIPNGPEINTRDICACEVKPC
jgi:hypothetical protein